MTTDPRFPIGKFIPQERTAVLTAEAINAIAQIPNRLEYALLNLDEAQLHTPYREGGWTVHQLVHHLADSHMNAFLRFKLGLTEDRPVIKPYNQDEWVKLADVSEVPVNISTTLLHSLHRRWAALLKSVGEDDWSRVVIHPEYGKEMSLWYLLQLYAWHGEHHVAHITSLRDRMGWW